MSFWEEWASCFFFTLHCSLFQTVLVGRGQGRTRPALPGYEDAPNSDSASQPVLPTPVLAGGSWEFLSLVSCTGSWMEDNRWEHTVLLCRPRGTGGDPGARVWIVAIHEWYRQAECPAQGQWQLGSTWVGEGAGAWGWGGRVQPWGRKHERAEDKGGKEGEHLLSNPQGGAGMRSEVPGWPERLRKLQGKWT